MIVISPNGSLYLPPITALEAPLPPFLTSAFKVPTPSITKDVFLGTLIADASGPAINLFSPINVTLTLLPFCNSIVFIPQPRFTNA